MARDFWNEERVALLIQLWEDGLSAGQVCESLGAESRNAILGKINRLRVGGHVFKRALVTDNGSKTVSLTRALARIAREKKAPKAKRENHNNFASYNVSRRAELPTRPVPVMAPVVDATFAKPWTERKFGECAYPLSGEGADTLSCCHKTGGKMYCKAHYKVMFRKPEDTGARFENGVARLAA